MDCPKCKTIQLRTPQPKSPSFCKQCGGMWMANLGASDFIEAVTEICPKKIAGNDSDKKTGVCPFGHGIMMRAKVDIDEPFYLEKCTTCGGIWFDQGEWLRIVENNFVENLSNIWSEAWQRKHRKEKNRDFFLTMNQKVLGENVFRMIVDLAEVLKNHPEKDRAIALLHQEIK
jgi:Zn-finger nucleic acid-binding protein